MSTTPGAPEAASAHLDPFAILPYFSSLRNRSSLRLFFASLVLFVPVIGFTLAEGTFGTSADFQPFTDIRRILGASDAPYSQPSFPLVRDIPNLFLILVICITIGLMHRQWILLAECVPGLERSGAFRPTKNQLDSGEPFVPRFSLIQKALFIPRLFADKPADVTPFDHLFTRLNSSIGKVGRGGAIVVVISFVLALLLAIGENHNGLFGVLAPPAPLRGERSWLTEAYKSWWAAIDHPGGFIVYLLLMTLGIYVVLVQNIVAVHCIVAVVTLNSVATFDLDWLNRDGSYGWLPLARVYRNLLWFLTMHGITLSLVLAALGLDNLGWVLGIVGIWIVVLPTYTLAPYLAFRKVRDQAIRRRIQRIEQALVAANLTPDDTTGLNEYRTEIAHVRGVRASPLRIRRAELPAILVAVMLPILLTLVQVLFSVRFGPTTP